VTYETIEFGVDAGVATITLNRPDAANGMNLPMMRDLAAAAVRCDESPEIRAAVITGAGRFFSAGGDVKGFSAAGDEAGALIKEMTMYFHAAVSRFSRMDAPLVGAVNGMAAGAGFSLAAACDLAIAAESAVFLSAYTAAALSPDGSSTYFVPRLVGVRRAAELMLTNRRLSATEAVDWGLINEVVADDELQVRAAEVAAGLAAGPTKAYGAVKAMLHASLGSSLETQMEIEARFIADMTRTADGAEGIAAFVEKRPPEFTGR
jgi:2-(1,2-epoxy-1,2-dihydrophenyl)acetyl-CoA isomerase